jgi:recombination protein RecT
MAEEKKQETGLQKFNRAITNPKTQEYLTSVLGERKGSFVNNLTALVANNSTLQACEPYTIMFAAMKATALNMPLDNSLGFAYVIPYKDNKRKVTLAQFQIGYKGYKQLALRTNQFAVIPNATDVREGELVSRSRLTGECVFRFIDNDEERNKLPIIGYCSYFRLLNGASSTYYMTKEEMENHAKRYSQSYRSSNEYVRKMSPWTQDFNSMALKTVLKLNLSKNAPLSIEILDAINADQAVMFKSDKEYEYVDNEESMYDAQKAMEVAEQFADFDEIVNGEENVKDDNTASDK